MCLCEFILTAFIAGAVEVRPGIMQVELFRQPETQPAFVETIHVPTDKYLQCWER